MRQTGPAVRIRPVLGDEVPVPTQLGCRLDEEVPESPAGEQTCEPRQNRSIRRLQRRPVDLASEDCHLVAQHDDLDGEIRVTATDQSDELQDTAERPVEEREGRRWTLAAPESRRQSPACDTRMGLSARAPCRPQPPYCATIISWIEASGGSARLGATGLGKPTRCM